MAYMRPEEPVDLPSDGTTVAVQRYLDALAGDPSSDLALRELLGRAARRLESLCGALLHRGYPRLTRAPLGLEAGDVLGAVVERLLKAMREVRPRTVRQFFALANRHIRWELNAAARGLDSGPTAASLEFEERVLAPEVTDSGVPPVLVRLLAAIDGLPEDEREAFDLIRVQDLTQAEAAGVLGVSTKTVQRRLQSAMVLLEESVGEIRPDGETSTG